MLYKEVDFDFNFTYPVTIITDTIKKKKKLRMIIREWIYMVKKCTLDAITYSKCNIDSVFIPWQFSILIDQRSHQQIRINIYYTNVLLTCK